MKKIVCWIFFIMLVLMMGACSEKTKTEVDQDEQQVINNGEAEGDAIEGKLVEVVGFKHWEKAFECMENIGKTASELSDDYQKWKYRDGAYGALHYEDLTTGRYYSFDRVREYDPYRPKLLGDEICYRTTIGLKEIFPINIWPANIENTKQYLEDYLEIEFEFLDEWDTGGGCLYRARVQWNSVEYGLEIWTEESGLLTPELSIGFARDPEEL